MKGGARAAGQAGSRGKTALQGLQSGARHKEGKRAQTAGGFGSFGTPGEGEDDGGCEGGEEAAAPAEGGKGRPPRVARRRGAGGLRVVAEELSHEGTRLVAPTCTLSSQKRLQGHDSCFSDASNYSASFWITLFRA